MNAESETCYLRAFPIFSARFSETISYAICLSDLGLLKWYEQGEAYMLQACQLFQTYFPEDISYAINLWNLGLLYKDTGRNIEAVERLHMALRIYDKNGD